MTKAEFIKYVKMFNKKPGEFTDDEIYAIGVTHQEMLRADKDWNEVASMLVPNKTGEQLRKWVLAKRYKNGVVPKNPKVLDDKTVSEVTTKEVEKSFDEQKAELYRERTKLRDTYAAYRRTLRDDARIELFKEEIVRAAEKMCDLPKVKPMETIGDRTTEMVVGVSDLHLGENFSNSYNSYSPEIAVKRLNKFAANIKDYCEKFNVKVLHVLNMGDMIAGIIHTSIRLEQTINVVDQAMMAAEMLAEFLNTLQEAAPVVTYRSVTDNHARLSPNKDEAIEKENLNRIIDWFIKERLKNTDIMFPNDNIDAGVGMFRINGKLFMFAHGHEDKKSSVVQDMIGLTNEWVSCIFLAHFHNSAEHTFQNCKVYVNGSIMGTDTYAYGRRLFSEPEQKLLVFDGDNVVDINIRLK